MLRTFPYMIIGHLGTLFGKVPVDSFALSKSDSLSDVKTSSSSPGVTFLLSKCDLDGKKGLTSV